MTTQTSGHVTQFSIKLQGAPNPLVFRNGNAPATAQVKFLDANTTTWRQVKPGSYVSFYLGRDQWRRVMVEAVTINDGEAISVSVDEWERLAALRSE